MKARKDWIADDFRWDVLPAPFQSDIFTALSRRQRSAQTVKSQTEAQIRPRSTAWRNHWKTPRTALEKNGGLRGSNVQWHSPANPTEYRALARYVPVLVVVVSQDESELPLKRVYVDADGKTTELQRISQGPKRRPDELHLEDSRKVSRDGYYLLPVALLSSQGRLVAISRCIRAGYQLAVITNSPLAFVQADSHPLPFPGDTPDQTVLHDFVKRHFQDIPLQD